MDYNIKYTNRAIEDMDAIKTYIAAVSPEGARKQLARIVERIHLLGFMPSGLNFDEKLGRKLHPDYSTQAVICDNYLILFVVDEDDNVVYVTHLISSKSNYLKLLK